MSDALVKVDGLYKKFCKNLKRSMAYGALDVSRSMLGMSRKSNRLRTGEFWALEDISFRLDRGEILGVIGVNGAGKSTLLRVLNGIYPPDAGRIEVRGGIGGLIALGAGFHPYLTGRENIFLNGTILGMKKREITRLLDSIIEFADIGSFVDSPVATYSSGMHARLGFSIAIHCVPDILLIDEVLSVGDFSFQNKCLRKISELRRGARGVIFVGHNLDMIETICDRAILLHDHKIHAQGDPLDVIAAYRSLSREIEFASDSREFRSKFEGENIGITTEAITYLGAGILNEYGEPITKIRFGEDIRIYYEIKANRDIERPKVGIGFSHPSVYPWNVAYDSNISNKTISVPQFRAGQSYRLVANFRRCNLIPGVYRLNVMIRDGDSLELFHQADKQQHTEFEIQSVEVGSFIMEGERPAYNLLIHLESSWECRQL